MSSTCLWLDFSDQTGFGDPWIFSDSSGSQTTILYYSKRCRYRFLAVISLSGGRHFCYDLKLTKNAWRHVATFISEISLRTEKWPSRKKVRKFRVKSFLKFRHFTSISLAFCYFEGDIRYIQSPSKYKGNTSKMTKFEEKKHSKFSNFFSRRSFFCQLIYVRDKCSDMPPGIFC